MRKIFYILLILSVYPILCFGWTETGGGDHSGADWIIAGDVNVSGTHWNINRFAVSNGVTASLISNVSFAVTAATVEVYGTINGNGRGSPAGQGIGKGTGGCGGGYGGAGGSNELSGGTVGPVCGTPDLGLAMLYPTNCGSGGGGTSGGAGGGAIHLTAANNGAMTINGTVTANGIGTSGSAGGGSGGSVWLDCGMFIGTGTVSAAGGDVSGSYGGGGGGGRIAIYLTNHVFSGSLSVEGGAGGSCGGGGNHDWGHNGHRGTISVSPGVWFPTVGGNHGGADWIIANNIAVAGDHWNIGRFVVNNGATAAVISPECSFSVTAATVEIYGMLTASNSGSLRSEGPGKGAEGSDYNGSGGGAYGGAGGSGEAGCAGGTNWGTPSIASARMCPTNWGSGGGSGSWNDYGGRGGGAIKLAAINSGAMLLNGTISANGGDGLGGGGAGGSIWLECANFSGTGMVSAVGGKSTTSSGGNWGGGSGGGGRIAVHSSNSTFTGTILVNGGSAAPMAKYGRPGTVYVPPTGGWLASAGGDHRGADWIILTNTTVGGTHFNVGRFMVSNGVTATLAAPECSFAVTSLTMEIHGTINGNGAGSLSSYGIGAGAQSTSGGGGGGYGGSGGMSSSGAAGGNNWGIPSITNEIVCPDEVGSGGGAASGIGGAGGGAIRLTARNNGGLVVNGTISANGNAGSGGAYGSGGGSGGSIWIECGQFNGNGTISAAGGNGGSGSSGYGGGGGGGRIAVSYIWGSFTNTGTFVYSGGTASGTATNGAAGTINFIRRISSGLVITIK